MAEVLADQTGWTRLQYWNEEPAVFKRSVGGFPFLVLFYLRAGKPVIVAYAFEGREPGYWKHRVEDDLV